MLFQVLVVIVLIILVVHQFDLWSKFKNWYARQRSGDATIVTPQTHNTKEPQRNIKGLIFIVLLGALFALIVAYFQTTQEIMFTSNAVALEQMVARPEAFTEAALASQIEIIQNSFNFGALYWNKFFENLSLFILLPVLISIAIVFLQDEMKMTKEQINNVDLSGNGGEPLREEADFEVRLADESHDLKDMTEDETF